MSLSKQPPIECILLPGMHGTNVLYDSLIQSLSDHAEDHPMAVHYRALNYPTELKQSYDLLLEWIKKEVDFTSNTVIIAESFSSPLAMRLADEYQDTVLGIVVAAGFCASPVNANLALLPLRPLFMLSPPRAAIKHFLLGNNASKEQLTKLRNLLSSIPSKALSQRLRSIMTLEEKDLPSIPETPVLLLQAQDDAVIPWENQNQLESHLAHAEIHWIESPHLLLQTCPEQCAMYIVQFLSSLPTLSLTDS